MRVSVFSLGVGLALVGWGSAVPAESRHNHMGLHMLAARATVSPDNTCGNSGAGANNGYACNATLGNAGGCCSTSGWCGNTTDYCGSGCQSAFGICNVEAPVSNTENCGASNSNLACTGGLCCSGAGWCGNTTDYCLPSNGCQSAFGACNTDAPSSPSGGTCGPQNGNTICADNQCCSVSGFCGTTQDFCSDPNNCAPGFGRCDSDTTPVGASTQTVARPLLGSVSYDDDVSDCTANNVVALSYDDGPYLYTSELLDILKQFGFTATFFITGNNNGKGSIDTTDPYPALIKRMVAEGHQVASHTWSHYSLDNSTQSVRMSQMVKNEMAFNNIIGKFPTYMRPPYSQCVSAACKADMKTLGYHRVYFDLDTQDYLNPLPSQIQKSKDIVAQQLKVAGVTDYLSIQHDIVQQSVQNLSSYYFTQIKNKGWKGVTVGECLGDPQANWYRSIAGSASTSLPVKLVTSTSAVVATTPAVTTPAVSTPAVTTPVVTTPTPTPAVTTPKCDLTIGKFCGKVNTFTSAATCSAAVAPCNTGYMSCLSQNGWLWVLKCAAWTQRCGDLNTYCRKCAKTCSNAGFAASGLGN